MPIKHTKKPGVEVSSDKLMCCILSVEFESEVCVILNLSEKNYTDMTGAINFSKYILPKVKRIKCYNNYDYVEYNLLTDGTWRAYIADLISSTTPF